MKVLLDLNVVLDVILNRQQWVAEASKVWDAHSFGDIEGFLVATEITNMFYIVRKLAGESTARQAVNACLATFRIVPVDQQVLGDADHLPGTDFEDNLCIACAAKAGPDLIVSPADLVAQFAKRSP